jgi:hypothetical protein
MLARHNCDDLRIHHIVLLLLLLLPLQYAAQRLTEGARLQMLLLLLVLPQ